MDLFTIIAALILLSAIFSYLNERFIKLPGTIGVVTLSIAVSILLLFVGKTNNGIANTIISLAQRINFSDVLLNVLFGFLLFASAIQFDYKELRAQRLPVILLSTLGVVFSAFVFASLLYGITRIIPIDLPLIYCLVFGALMLFWGIVTRLAAFGFIVNFLGVVLSSHFYTGFFMNWGMQAGKPEWVEYFILLFGLAIAIFITGGGKASLAAVLMKNNK